MRTKDGFWMVRCHPELNGVLDYLREHGPGTVADMRAAGVEVDGRVIRRMYNAGLVRKMGSVKVGKIRGKGLVWRWGLM